MGEISWVMDGQTYRGHRITETDELGEFQVTDDDTGRVYTLDGYTEIVEASVEPEHTEVTTTTAKLPKIITRPQKPNLWPWAAFLGIVGYFIMTV